MERGYFNFRTQVAGGRRQEQQFLHRWWQFYSGDSHWAPPYYPALRGALESDHLRRCQPAYLTLEALPRSVAGEQQPAGPGQPLMAVDWEKVVATAAVLHDPRQRAALLTFLRCANDRQTLRQLLERAADEGQTLSFLGPVNLSPYLGAGVLASHWNETPPSGAPYAPPYLAELLGSIMELAAETRLYHLPVPEVSVAGNAGTATLSPLRPSRLAGDLLPLVSAIYRNQSIFAPLDAVEAAFLLDWWAALVPLTGWLAEVEGRPAGFVLLQPDIGPWLQRANGGRRIWRRWRLQRAGKQARRGRILLGGVAPDNRRRGIGGQLLAASLQSATSAGWQSLVIGPVAEKSAAAALLEKAGAEPRQRYQLFRWQAASEGWW
jgi:GNAT superfamily N-acetyltransferase